MDMENIENFCNFKNEFIHFEIVAHKLQIFLDDKFNFE
jgi:hypothetical protein